MTEYANSIIEGEECLTLDTLYSYGQDQLDASATYRVEKHLMGCELCASALEAHATVAKKEAILLAGAIDQKVGALVGATPTAIVMPLWAKQAAAVAAVLAVIFTVGYFIDFPAGDVELAENKVENTSEEKPSAKAKIAAPQTVDNEQIIEAITPEENNEIEETLVLQEAEAEDLALKRERSQEALAEINRDNLAQENDASAELKQALSAPATKLVAATETTAISSEKAVALKSNANRGGSMARVSILSRTARGSKSAGVSKAESAPSATQGRKSADAYSNESAESVPFFPGGGDNLMIGYIAKNIAYPAGEPFGANEGVVHVTFTVNSKGNVIGTSIKKGVNKQLDNIVLKVVDDMPKWSLIKGADVQKVDYTVAVKLDYKYLEFSSKSSNKNPDKIQRQPAY